jgi:hypothetical protein
MQAAKKKTAKLPSLAIRAKEGSSTSHPQIRCGLVTAIGQPLILAQDQVHYTAKSSLGAVLRPAHARTPLCADFLF